MRLLVDQDIYKISIDNLREWGHDVLTVKELGLQQASDEEMRMNWKKLSAWWSRIGIESAAFRRGSANSPLFQRIGDF